MRTRTLVASALAAALSSSVLAFGVTTEGATAATAVRDGDTVSFEGYANTPDPGRSQIPGKYFLTPFANADVADAVGIDLQDAFIEELEDGSGLRFTWQLGSDLPPQGVPEGVRYMWTFDAGGETYQLQAKRTNVASSTTAESPSDHAMEAVEGDWWYQLRGACVDGGGYPAPQSPISGCYHLGFFSGSVDVTTGTITMDLPYEAEDQIGRGVASTFRRGVPVTAQTSAGSSISASMQAVASTADVSQFINGWGTYYPGTVVSVALGEADGPTGSYALLDTPGDGSFAGELTGAGTHLWVRACSGYAVQGLDTPQPCIEGAHAIG